MRLIGRILLWSLLFVVALAVLLALSIPVDAVLGRGRVAQLTNTAIPGPDGGEVRAYVARPATPGPWPAVIMIHEFWGLRPEIVGKADALAAEGYLVVAPDTFRGGSTSWIPRAIFQTVTTSTEQVHADLDAVFAWVAAQPDVHDLPRAGERWQPGQPLCSLSAGGHCASEVLQGLGARREALLRVLEPTPESTAAFTAVSTPS